MGSIRRTLAAGLLVTSLAVGAGSVKALVDAGNEITRDPDYIAAIEIQKIAEKVSDGVKNLHHYDEIPSSYRTIKVPDVPEVRVRVPGQRERFPEVEEAKKDIDQAIEYLKPLQERVDAEGKIKKELRDIEKSLPKSYSTDKDRIVLERDDSYFSKQEKRLGDIASELSRMGSEYQQSAIDKTHNTFKYIGGLGGVVISLVGGIAGAVNLVNNYEDKRRGIEEKLGFFAIGSLFLSMFYLTSNITGNIIKSSDYPQTSFIGIVLFVLGLVLICVRSRIKK